MERDLTPAQREALRRGRERAEQAGLTPAQRDAIRRGEQRAAGVGGRPPTGTPRTTTDDQPEPEYHRSHFNLRQLRVITNGYQGVLLRQFFMLKVAGQCDSDAFVQYTKADQLISECWHATVGYKDSLVEDCDVALDANDADGVPNDSNESLFGYLKLRNIRAQVIEVMDFYVRDADEE